MDKQWRWVLTAAAVFALTLAVPPAVGNSQETAEWQLSELHSLSEVNVAKRGADGPSVTLVSNGTVSYESFVLDGPDRLVIDLHDVISRLDSYKFPVGAGGVVQIRASQHTLRPVPITRVVFDLETALAYRINQMGSSIVISFGDGGVQTASVEDLPAIEMPQIFEPEIPESPETVDAPAAAPTPDAVEPSLPAAWTTPLAEDRETLTPAAHQAVEAAEQPEPIWAPEPFEAAEQPEPIWVPEPVAATEQPDPVQTPRPLQLVLCGY